MVILMLHYNPRITTHFKNQIDERRAIRITRRNVKSKNLKSIEYNQSNTLNKIDDYEFGTYIFKRLWRQTPNSGIYKRLFGERHYTVEEMMNQISRPLWIKYARGKENIDRDAKEKQK